MGASQQGGDLCALLLLHMIFAPTNHGSPNSLKMAACPITGIECPRFVFNFRKSQLETVTPVNDKGACTLPFFLASNLAPRSSAFESINVLYSFDVARWQLVFGLVALHQRIASFASARPRRDYCPLDSSNSRSIIPNSKTIALTSGQAPGGQLSLVNPFMSRMQAMPLARRASKELPPQLCGHR